MPWPNNAPTPEDLPGIPDAELAQLPVDLLATLQAETDEMLRHAKSTKAKLDGALTLRYGPRASRERLAQGKDTGTVRFDDGDVTVVTDLPKRVDWDQERLAAIVERIRCAGDDPGQYVDTTIKVSERKYAAWPAAIRSAFEPARTVRTGALKVELLPQGGDR